MNNGSPWIALAVVLACANVMTCHAGFQEGYEAHRADVCRRDHGVWMERVGTDRKACVFGVRR